MIPRNIFQTQRSLQYIESNEKLRDATNSWKVDGFNYAFYSDDQCSDFMRLYFPEIFPIYDKLQLPVMKADLWRYCVVYKYGGIYADSDTILKADPNIFIRYKMLMMVPENDAHICQWVFAAPPGSPILKSVIDLSVKRILETEFKGDHIVHYLTGPGVFSDGIINYLSSKNLKTHSDPTNYHIRNILKYEDNLIDEIYVFAHDTFHQYFVHHLFSGNWENGWTKQRDRILSL